MQASSRFPYNRHIRMRPAYFIGSQIYIGEALLMTDPWSMDLAGAIGKAYQGTSPAELGGFINRLNKARGLTSR